MSMQNSPPQLVNIASDLHRISEDYSCGFSIKNGEIHCKWHPKMPPQRKLQRIIQSGKYFAARDSFLSEIAKQIDGNVICVNLEGDKNDH